MQAENGHLRQELDEAKDKIDNLQKSCKLLEVSRKETENTIEQFSEKCKHQTAEIEALKIKCKKLTEKLTEVEKVKVIEVKRNDEKEEAKNEVFDNSRELFEEERRRFQNQLLEKEEQVKILNEKLQQTNAKLYETKNNCTLLRQEINKAQKVLAI